MKTHLPPWTWIACGLLALSLSVLAQTSSPPAGSGYQPLTDYQLDKLLAPIALYPDPLIAEILPASTLPIQIVLADRFISGGGDTNLIAQQPWDASVQALAHYPTVLRWMDDNLPWTTALGNAVLYQQADVIASIQRLRAAAQNYGNLQSTPQQQVVYGDGNIELLPEDENVIYVPVYNPDLIYVQPCFGYPVITFPTVYVIGPWLGYDINWRQSRLIHWDQNHPRPSPWWQHSENQQNLLAYNQAPVWHATNPGGFGPGNFGPGNFGPGSFGPGNISLVTPGQRPWNQPNRGQVNSFAPNNTVQNLNASVSPNGQVSRAGIFYNPPIPIDPSAIHGGQMYGAPDRASSPPAAGYSEGGDQDGRGDVSAPTPARPQEVYIPPVYHPVVTVRSASSTTSTSGQQHH